MDDFTSINIYEWKCHKHFNEDCKLYYDTKKYDYLGICNNKVSNYRGFKVKLIVRDTRIRE